MKPFLSKSKYLSGIQCHKLLWLQYNKPELIPSVSPSQQRVFDQGTEVGELARERFPCGLLIEADYTQIPEAVHQTKEAIRCGDKIIFEGAFNFDNVFARPDVIQKMDSGKWNIIEVKSSTSVKVENIHDVAVQVYTLANILICQTSLRLMILLSRLMRFKRLFLGILQICVKRLV